ncbi:MAG: hypothetical protein ACI3XA_07895 [Clostridia bacterium]
MKRILSLVLAFALACTLIALPVSAEETPTAKVVAYTDATAPAAGEMFLVTFGLEDVSTNAFNGGQVGWTWPTEVASLADTYYGTAITNVDDVMNAYHLGEFINPFKDGRPATGKFETTSSSSTDLETGYTALALTMAQKAPDKAAEVTEDGTFVLFTVGYVLNEGYTMDDFYIELKGESTELLLDPEKPLLASKGDAVTLESRIGKKEVILWKNSIHQPGVGNADANGTDGIYELPTALVAGRTYTVSFAVQTNVGNADTLIGLNNAAAMTANNYFSGSTMMMQFNGTDLNVRPAEGMKTIGQASSANTTIDVVVNADLINNTWDVTFSEAGEVKASATGLSFRNTNGIPVDSLVLCDNKYGSDILIVDASTVKVVDTTPASVGDVVFKYVAADGTVLEEVKMSGETGATVSVAAKTLTVDGVKYEAPVASGVVGTDDVVEVKCAKVETVTISYTVNGEEVGTATVEGVAGAKVDVAEYNYYNTKAIYKAEARQIEVDAENLTVAVELEVVYEGIVATRKQIEDAKNVLDEAITGKAKVSYDVVLINPGDGLVAFSEGADLSDNWFAQSSAYLAFKGGEVFYRQSTDAANQKLADVTVPGTYTVSATVDVEAKTWTVSIADAEGTVLGTVENAGFRNTDVEALDTLLVLDNGEVGGTLVVQNVKVEAVDEPTDPSEEPTAPSEEPTAPSEEPTAPSEEPTAPSEEPTAPSEEPTAPSEEPTAPSEEPTAPSEEPTVPSEEPTAPSEEPTAPSEEPTVPSEEPTVPSEEPTAPSEVEPTEPSEEPGDEEDLPFVAEDEDVEVTSTALGVRVSGTFEATEATGLTKVVVVVSYLRNGAPYSVGAVEADVVDGVVTFANGLNVADGAEYTVAGVSLVTGVNALEAILGGSVNCVPVGVWKLK